jgi:hypothetical protein
MKKILYTFLCFNIAYCTGLTVPCNAQETHSAKRSLSAPVISGLMYDSITTDGVTVHWTTDSPADSKISVAKSDSNYQPFNAYLEMSTPNMSTNHIWRVWCPYPGRIFKFLISSQNAGGLTADSGYFVSQSASTGKTEVYFTHSVDTSVSTGEIANGNADFASLLIDRINKAKYSIDVAIWEFNDYPSIADALISAKNRGVKVRFIYSHASNTPTMDSLAADTIPIIHRNYDTIGIMHNKFWIFDYRYNSDSSRKYLCTGSANVSHAMFHSDRNNMIFIQDESLCAIFTREFEQMWGSHTDLPDTTRSRFGPQKFNNIPHVLNVAGIRMEVYFSPNEGVPAFLENTISTKTTYSLFFGMLKFDLASMEDNLHSIFNMGRQVCGVFDSSLSFEANSAYPRMKGLAVPHAWMPHADVFIDTIDGLLHHKYLIIDANTQSGNKITSTGSFNWQLVGSQENDDNSLTIFDPRVNNLFYQEFVARYKESGGKMLGQAIETQTPGPVMLNNYPNPFSGSTRIIYTINKQGWVNLGIFNDNGMELSILADQQQNPGTYEVNWDAQGFPAGVYFCKLTTDDFSTVRKMIIIR